MKRRRKAPPPEALRRKEQHIGSWNRQQSRRRRPSMFDKVATARLYTLVKAGLPEPLCAFFMVWLGGVGSGE